MQEARGSTHQPFGEVIVPHNGAIDWYQL